MTCRRLLRSGDNPTGRPLEEWLRDLSLELQGHMIGLPPGRARSKALQVVGALLTAEGLAAELAGVTLDHGGGPIASLSRRR